MTGTPQGRLAFGTFMLDPADRQLRRSGEPVELNARYFDALALLASERGKLVTKDRFLEEVWRGVPVTDEALTQCIRTLRRLLGDDAAAPRFIETVPKHGYRFVAPVELLLNAEAGVAAQRQPASRWREFWFVGLSGTAGGAIAGLVGGLFYGFAAAAEPGMGAASVLLVVVCVTIFVGLVGAAGVAFGIAAAALVSSRAWQWSALGGGLGGLVVGALVKLLGTDAFSVLLGRTPGDITGAPEGALLGAAVGFGSWLALRSTMSTRRGIAAAALLGGAAGALIPLLGGRLMGGSLGLLAGSFPGSRLRLDQIGSLFGEDGLGPASQVVTAGLEGMLFAGCMVGAMLLAQRRERRPT